MIPQEFPAAFWLFLKTLTILGFIIYTVFAVVMVRQEHLMSNVLEEAFEKVLRIFAYIHLVAAIFMIVLALLIL